MKRHHHNLQAEPLKRPRFYDKKGVNDLFDEYESFLIDNKDYWGYAFYHKVVEKQVEIFNTLSNREKLIIHSYKNKGDYIINSVMRGKSHYSILKNTRIWRGHPYNHPFFPLIVDEAFDSEVINNVREFRACSEKYSTDDLSLYFKNLSDADYMKLAFELTDKFNEILDKFPVLEYPIMVYRGDVIKWRSGHPKVVPAITSTSLEPGTARGFLQDSTDGCCFWKIMILPGTKILFIDTVLLNSGWLNGGNEAEIIFVTLVHEYYQAHQGHQAQERGRSQVTS